MTAKVSRKWTSYVVAEDLELSNRQVAVKVITTDMDSKHEGYDWETVTFGKSPSTTGALSPAVSLFAFLASSSFLALI